MDTNQQQVSNYQSHLAVRVEDATRELECFRLEHTMQYNELSLSLETFVKTHLEELARFSTNVTELKSVASSGLAALGELSSSVQRSVEGDLSEIAGSIEAANEQLLLQLQQRQAELEANASTMIERLASLNSKVRPRGVKRPTPRDLSSERCQYDLTLARVMADRGVGRASAADASRANGGRGAILARAAKRTRALEAPHERARRRTATQQATATTWRGGYGGREHGTLLEHAAGTCGTGAGVDAATA